MYEHMSGWSHTYSVDRLGKKFEFLETEPVM